MITIPAAPATVSLHPSPVGMMRAVWTDRGLYALQWRDPNEPAVEGGLDQNLDPDVRPDASLLDDLLDEYFSTGDADFGEIRLDDQGWTAFRRRVYRCCREIPPGTKQTYKQLAAVAGNDKASRAVGGAMADNRVLLVIPCHRVVGSSGGLHGFSGPGGLSLKRFLLDLESR